GRVVDSRRHESAQQVEVAIRRGSVDDLAEPDGRIHACKVPPLLLSSAIRSSTTFDLVYPGAFLETQPDKPALIMVGSGFTQTFAELDAAANRLSRLLRSVDVQPGDHVAICMENHDRYFEVIWGCHYAGALYTACSSRLT